VTAALDRLRAGDAAAKGRLIELIYDDLRAVARRLMARERAGHTLEPTALVNESLLRLADTRSLKRLEDRGHLMAAATEAFRRVLIDHARARRAQKRGGGRARVGLDEALERAAPPADTAPPVEHADQATEVFDRLLAWYDEQGLDVIALDDVLDELRDVDPRWFDVVLLRFFGGLGVDRTAEILGVSPRTVTLDWNRARAWLHVRLGGGDD
jgi:RNA polymerase sigma factor (TIGR02999 family)